MLTLHRRVRGFTLIELMIAVAIIAILMTIAVPAYSRYVMRGHRSAAQAAMMDIASRQQQILLANRSYLDGEELAASGYVLPPEVGEHYTLDVDADVDPAPSFLITLTPTGSQADDGELTLDHRGNKTPESKWRGR
jgi:type IV pilus assembly protein PilE